MPLINSIWSRGRQEMWGKRERHDMQQMFLTRFETVYVVMMPSYWLFEADADTESFSCFKEL